MYDNAQASPVQYWKRRKSWNQLHKIEYGGNTDLLIEKKEVV